MTFRELLRQNKDAIAEKWIDDILAMYPGTTAAALARQRDPFANPVGHSLRVGTRGILEALIDRREADEIRHHLQEIIKIRAVQQFSASQAVSFVFHLREIIRTQLGKAVSDPQLTAELAEFERWIDRVGLAAFDVFVQCREQVYELRINEMKRSVSWVVDKMKGRRRDDGVASTQTGVGTSKGMNVRQEDPR